MENVHTRRKEDAQADSQVHIDIWAASDRCGRTAVILAGVWIDQLDMKDLSRFLVTTVLPYCKMLIAGPSWLWLREHVVDSRSLM